MKKNIYKNLANISYNGNEIDEGKTRNIAKSLKRSELRKYINELKLKNEKQVVRVTIPDIKISDMNKLKNKIQAIFPEKRIEITIDPSLLVGIKIIDNDLVYDYNLKSVLNSMLSYINKRYES